MKKIGIGFLLLLMAFSSYSMDIPLYEGILTKEETLLEDLLKEIGQKIGPLLLTHTGILSFVTQRFTRHMKAKTFEGYFGPGSISANESILVIKDGRPIRSSLLRVYAPQTGVLLSERFCNAEGGYVDINREGTRILSAPSGRPFAVWNAQAPYEKLYVVPTRVPYFACFTPDGTQVVTFGKGEHALSFWNYETDECVRSIADPIGCMWGEFSPDGTHLLTIGKMGTAKVWEVESGECVQVLNHESDNELTSAHYNADGCMVVTASKEGAIKVWDVKTGECLKEFNNYGEIKSAHFYGIQYIVCITKDPAEFESKNCKLWLWNVDSGTNYYAALLNAHHAIAFLKFNGSLALVDCSKNKSFDVLSLEKVLDLLQFLHERITVKQAFVLCRVYEHTLLRGMIALKETNEEKVVTEDGVVLSRDAMKFDFNTCPHLQKVYDSLPDEIKAMFDAHVIKIK